MTNHTPTNLQREKKIQVGDIIVVSNPLFGLREYPVTKIEGSKAITDFRVFNTKIYPPNMVYEYGKRADSTTNCYWVKKTDLCDCGNPKLPESNYCKECI